MPGTTGVTLTMGGEGLRNTGNVDVIIDKVSLGDPRGLSYVDSAVLPATNNLVGYRLTYPPNDAMLADDGLKWSDARPAVGATIKPRKGDVIMNLVTGIRVTGGTGSTMSGVVVDYHTPDGTAYRVKTPIALLVKAPPARC